jgi:protein-S-isoprenylcysteine O-methyltransferase Ste14
MAFERIELGQFQLLRIGVFWAITGLLVAFVLFFRSAWEDFEPLGIEVEDLIEIVGLGLIGIAILGRLWCTLYIGGHKSVELVQIGPYSVTRNPLYLFSTLGAAGVGAQTGSIVVSAACALLTGLLLQLTMRREEMFLSDRFGAAYDAYRARVPGFFPRRALFNDMDTLQIAPHRLYRTLGDGLIFFLAMPAFEFIEYLQDGGVIPVFFRFL